MVEVGRVGIILEQRAVGLLCLIGGSWTSENPGISRFTSRKYRALHVPATKSSTLTACACRDNTPDADARQPGTEGPVLEKEPGFCACGSGLASDLSMLRQRALGLCC